MCDASWTNSTSNSTFFSALSYLRTCCSLSCPAVMCGVVQRLTNSNIVPCTTPRPGCLSLASLLAPSTCLIALWVRHGTAVRLARRHRTPHSPPCSPPRLSELTIASSVPTLTDHSASSRPLLLHQSRLPRPPPILLAHSLPPSYSLPGIVERLVRPLLASRSVSEEVQAVICLGKQKFNDFDMSTLSFMLAVCSVRRQCFVMTSQRSRAELGVDEL